jgi:predicted Ser/Thr protein kinase
MAVTRSAELSPASLPVGALLGHWQVVGRSGWGSYGAVYRVVRQGQESGSPAALKIALRAFDPRFEREVELLSRIHHPGVPAVVDRGFWTDPEGHVFPYLVMGWVEGLPLYEWAAKRRSTSRQVMELLAQVARALEATHAAGCVHRDVKGDNVLVSEEGRAWLIDFGCGWHEGARRLTETALPPGTPPYRSGEALRFQFRFRQDMEAHYAYPPEDDLYALGVTAYRLVTGSYPPPRTDPEYALDPSRPRPPPLLPPRELATVNPELDALILILLAEDPRARGTASAIAIALEQAAQGAGHEADVPVGPTASMVPTERTERPGPRPWHARMLAWMSFSRAVSLAGALVLGIWLVAPRLAPNGLQEEAPRQMAQSDAQDAGVDGGTAGLGEEVLTAPMSVHVPVLEQASVAVDVPREPLRGQRRPPCHPTGEVELHGGCWVQIGTTQAPCGTAGFEWDGKCYLPSFPTQRQPTSDTP